MTKKFKELKDKFQNTQNKDELIEIFADLIKNNENFVEKVVDNSHIEKVARLQFLPKDIEIVHSLNEAPYLNSDSIFVIVGTITSWDGIKNGYYYTSVYNRVYSVLDEIFNLKNTDSSLVKQKILLKKTLNQEEKQKVIEKIKNILKKHKIVFIDVIKSAIRVKKNASDDKILLFSLDYNAFKNCENIKKFICTSKNASNCLKKIFEKNNCNADKNKIEICHQDRFHFKKEEWAKAFGEIVVN